MDNVLTPCDPVDFYTRTRVRSPGGDSMFFLREENPRLSNPLESLKIAIQSLYDVRYTLKIPIQLNLGIQDS